MIKNKSNIEHLNVWNNMEKLNVVGQKIYNLTPFPQSHQPVKKNYINHFYPFLKFTWKISETYMSFLDSLISINGDALTTSVFISQPIHTFANLFSSSQSNHSAPLVTLNSCLTLNYCVFPAFNAFPKTLGPNLCK